jgi:hypothetical protein
MSTIRLKPFLAIFQKKKLGPISFLHYSSIVTDGMNSNI